MAVDPAGKERCEFLEFGGFCLRVCVCVEW